MNEIERAEMEVGELRRALSEAERKLKALLIAESPFQVGDEVEAKVWRASQQVWLPARVTQVRPYFQGHAFHVRTKNKDGSWSKNQRDVFRDVRPLGSGEEA